MASEALLQLAQDLEWLGCELEHYGHLHAQEGFPCAGATWDAFLAKQRGLVTTAEKIERELSTAVHYNPTTLVGVDYPLSATLESIAVLMAAIEDIKQAGIHSVQELPPKVRDFSRMVQSQFGALDAIDE
jgi:hypothetical protein